MKKLLIAITLTLSLAGCASVQNALNTLTSVQITPRQVYLAENSFDAIEIVATGYLRICYARMSTPGCSSTAISKIVPAVRSGRVARAKLHAFMKAHPDALGASGLYDLLVAATDTLNSFSIQYNIAGVTK